MSILSTRLSTTILSAPRSKINPAIIPFLSQVPRVKHYSISSMFRPSYTCDIDAEPLHRYRPGGYHPILLGDLFKDQRYKVIQKIGWGGNSTTWVARDQLHNRNVALKVSVSEKSSNNEAHVLNAISKLSEESLRQDHPGQHHLMRMLDHFTVDGPNGIHDCLVLELLGPSVPDVIESLYSDGRLPADFAKSTAYQALLGIDYLSSHKIGHGDLHSRNIVFALPNLASLDEVQFLEKFGRPETTPVRSVDGMALTAHLPNYIVRPISFHARGMREELRRSTVKIIDFGEAFFRSQSAVAVHTPLAVRAPEAIFDDRIDYRIDTWSMGCLLFELVAGQPPFDVVMLTRAILVSEMMEFCGELPDRWREKLDTIGVGRTEPVSDAPCTLLDWLQDIYFDDNKTPGFTRQDIAKVCELVTRMLKFEPSSRASAKEITSDLWFNGLKS
ncbi:kinase-like domain-containing protein [Xylaria bambusicola]|uniref:kinase-like domain-containing protein n=1 Tax=Xylaria bambusicola TaxID=326684 RepID=UPI0020074CD9|nr:kinase-like domain-containing protein [Xylaria bambusicola]KAI0502815.1 kinase-like domain-containing protein [Xylaria bambusicola]